MKIIIFDDNDYFYDKHYLRFGQLLKKGLDSIESPYVMFCVGISSNEFKVVYDSASRIAETKKENRKSVDELIDTDDIVFLDLLWNSSRDVADCRKTIIEKVKSMASNLFIYTTRGGEEALALDRNLEQEMGDKYLGYTVVRLERIGDDFAEAIKILTE